MSPILPMSSLTGISAGKALPSRIFSKAMCDKVLELVVGVVVSLHLVGSIFSSMDLRVVEACCG